MKPTDDTFDQLIEHMEIESAETGSPLNDDEERLIHLFRAHASIREHWYTCLMIPPPTGTSMHSWHGLNFHKGFRQIDVTDSGKIDSEIWGLLAGATTSFWKAHADVFTSNN